VIASVFFHAKENEEANLCNGTLDRQILSASSTSGVRFGSELIAVDSGVKLH
jgi:hypothetical protein